MGLPPSTVTELRRAGVDLALDFDLARRTWWRVGGPADGFARVETVEQLVAVQRHCHGAGVPVFALGNGSNLLVSDRGVRGVVVQLGGSLAGVEVAEQGPPPVLVAGGGLKLARFVSKAEAAGWTGMEVFAGIPGTIGGAVRMNAGARLGETVDVLLDVDVVLPDGTLTTVPASDLHMSYRSCTLPAGAIVAAARLRVTEADPAETFERMHAFLARRKATQPTAESTCGSTFRNPPGDYAGRLVEAAGLKGLRIGAAEVSTMHANFVVNRGNATADDLRRLIEHVRDEVIRRFGVKLHPEVHFVGDWTHWEAAQEAPA